jgi:hypothetical protein
MPRFLEIPNWTPGRLNYVVSNVQILAECQACGDRREFDRGAVPENMRHALISEIEPRLKCSACGERKGKLRFGSWAAE